MNGVTGPGGYNPVRIDMILLPCRSVLSKQAISNIVGKILFVMILNLIIINFRLFVEILMMLM